MTSQSSASDVLACVFLAISVFGASLVPFFLLVEADHLTPRFVRELPAAASKARATAAVTVAALLLLLTPAAPEATR